MFEKDMRFETKYMYENEDVFAWDTYSLVGETVVSMYLSEGICGSSWVHVGSILR